MGKINLAQFTTVLKTVGTFYTAHKKTIKTIGKYTTGGAALLYAACKAPKTVHDLEDAGMKKGEPLSFGEKTSIVIKNQYPAMFLGVVSTGIDISMAVDASKEVTNLTEENKSLIGQIAEIGNAYNTVTVVKEAMTKKIEEDHGKEVVNDIQKTATEETMKEQYVAMNPANRAYVYDNSRLNFWNDIYLRTGNPNYKIQEFFIPLFGQSILSCNQGIYDADKKLNELMSPEKGKGYINANDVIAELHAREIDSKLGDNIVWRYQFETFTIIPSEMNLDGIAVRRLDFYSDFHYDREGMYYD